MQEYEKQLRKVKAPLCTAKAQEKSGAAHHTHNMLNGSYSKTFIFTSQYPGKPTGKKVIKHSFIECSGKSLSLLTQAVLDILALPKSDLDDFMEDDRCAGPVSSSDPMLSSPAPSTLSSSPSSFYSSDENLSPESMDHLIV